MQLEQIDEENILELAKQVFRDSLYLGIGIDYNLGYSQFGIYFFNKNDQVFFDEKAIFNHELYFILNRIRMWFPFDYEDEYDYYEDLKTLNIKRLTEKTFLSRLRMMQNIIEKFEYSSSFQIMLKTVINTEAIIAAYSVKEDWNYKCLYVNTKDTLVVFIWSTSE